MSGQFWQSVVIELSDKYLQPLKLTYLSLGFDTAIFLIPKSVTLQFQYSSIFYNETNLIYRTNSF